MKVNFWYTGSLEQEHRHHTPSSVVKGLAGIGCEVAHMNPSQFSGEEMCDINVIYGMRINGKEIIDASLEKGIQSIVIDLGYINRAMRSNGYDGYWQVSLNGLNWLPKNADDKRFKALGIDYPKRNERDGYVLIAEQTPGDSSHGMDMQGLKAWTQKAVSMCEELGLKYKVRRHPMNKQGPQSSRPDCEIEEDIKGASCVYVHNSNVGNDALLAGIPVVCDEKARYLPTYHNVVGHDLSAALYPKDIEGYLNRLAYGQWTRGEIEDGSAFKYIIEQAQ